MPAPSTYGRPGTGLRPPCSRSSHEQHCCPPCTDQEAEAWWSHSFGGSTAGAWTLVPVTGPGRAGQEQQGSQERGSRDAEVWGFALGLERGRRGDSVRGTGQAVPAAAEGLTETCKGGGLEPLGATRQGGNWSPVSKEGHTTGEALASQPLSRFDYS